MKKIYLFIASFLFALTINAQEENSVENLLNRTETSIYKAQKQLIASTAPKSTGELTLAVKYQVLAVAAYKNSDSKSAVCYSLKAREYTNEIFTRMNLDLPYFRLNTDENRLAEQNNYLSSDSSYSSKITNEAIDESILFDPQKLGTIYKISIN